MPARREDGIDAVVGLKVAERDGKHHPAYESPSYDRQHLQIGARKFYGDFAIQIDESKNIVARMRREDLVVRR